MNRIGYYQEDGKLKMEWQEVSPITEEEASGRFKVINKPAYLQIFFRRLLDEDELFDIYAVLIENNIIEMTREEMDKEIQEDLKKQTIGRWELKCEFQDALNCAIRLGNDISFHEGAFTFQISDEPTKFMKNWLENKDLLKRKIAEETSGFNPCIYADDSLGSIDIDKNREMNFLSRLISRMSANGATEEELSGIVKYSMVVIDAEKHHLNWRQAAIDFHVQEMKDKYYRCEPDKREKPTSCEGGDSDEPKDNG